MTDNEKRAHDLAVMYTHYELTKELAEDGGFDINDDSAFSIYQSAYTNFLDNLAALD